MSSRRDRAEILPNANNPRLLMRLVGLVAAGIRRPGALADVLEVELRTVHYYTQAAAWLGLLEGLHDIQLTRHGLGLAFAEPRQRVRHYAHAVWRTPAARDLLAGRREMPDAEVVLEWIQAQAPDLAESTARRRVSSIRSLLEPAMRHRPSARAPQGEQLQLPFGRGPAPLESGPPPRPAERPVDHNDGEQDNLDVYARVFRALLEHGELRTGHIRALLDAWGAGDVPLGSYAELAVRRGDAVRDGDRLVATQGAIARRVVADDPLRVALTDPSYRRWLHLARREEARLTPMERRERDSHRRRFHRWNARVFGEFPSAQTVQKALARLLPGRMADHLPLAGAKGRALPKTEGPFLEHLAVKHLPISFPSSLTAFAGGVSAANALARRNRAAPVGVRVPDAMEPRRVFHGGLLFPGESRPRLVPDNFSLRLRLVSCAPALSILAALLLLGRRTGVSVQVQLGPEGPKVRVQRDDIGALISVFAAFCRAQDWALATPPHGGLSSTELCSLARAVGIASRTGNRLVLDEELFVKLQDDPEARLVYDALVPLEDRLHAWLDTLEAPVPTW